MDRYTKHTNYNYNYTKNTTKTTDNLKKHRNQEEQKELKTNETSLFHTNSSKQTQYSSNTLETSDAESHYTSPIKRYGSWCSVAYNGADDKPIVYYSSNYKKSLLSPTKGVEPKQGGYKTMRYVSAETVGLTPNLRIEKELEALSKLETICLTKRLQCKELTNMVEELNHRKYSITLSGEFDEVLPKLINFIIKNDTLINQNFIDKLFSKENYEGYNATSD